LENSLHIDSTKKIKLIQVFRGLAAIIVILHHVTLSFAAMLKYDYLKSVFVVGWSGVDFFFCLSGFIIYYISYNDIGHPNRIKQYVINRIIRIYPIVWVTTILAIILYNLLPMFSIGYENDPKSILKSLLLIPQRHLPIVATAWSLSHEMLFYTIFGLFMYYGKRAITPFIITWIVVILLKFLGIVTFNHYLLKFLFYGNDLQFIMGCLSAYIVINLRIQRGSLFIFTGIIGFITAWILTMNDLLIRETFSSVLAFGFSSICLIIGAASLERQKVVNIPRFLVFLGDASYSIYLIHIPLVPVLIKVCINTRILEYSRFISATLTWVVLVLLGCLFHKYIEKPLHSVLRKKFTQKPTHEIYKEAKL
jgi:exopolysaccharide production protein ExoZ